MAECPLLEVPDGRKYHGSIGLSLLFDTLCSLFNYFA